MTDGFSFPDSGGKREIETNGVPKIPQTFSHKYYFLASTFVA
jgi:hypothetical protein